MKSLTKSKKSIIQKFSMLAVLCAGILAWTGCEKDYNYVAPPAQGTMSLATDIQPLFTANCALSGCHDGNNYDPDLRVGAAHAAMFNIAGCIDTINPESSDLYIRITATPGSSGFMPDGGSALPSADINKILLWIQQGAKDN